MRRRDLRAQRHQVRQAKEHGGELLADAAQPQATEHRQQRPVPHQHGRRPRRAP